MWPSQICDVHHRPDIMVIAMHAPLLGFPPKGGFYQAHLPGWPRAGRAFLLIATRTGHQPAHRGAGSAVLRRVAHSGRKNSPFAELVFEKCRTRSRIRWHAVSARAHDRELQETNANTRTNGDLV